MLSSHDRSLAKAAAVTTAAVVLSAAAFFELMSSGREDALRELSQPEPIAAGAEPPVRRDPWREKVQPIITSPFRPELDTLRICEESINAEHPQLVSQKITILGRDGLPLASTSIQLTTTGQFIPIEVPTDSNGQIDLKGKPDSEINATIQYAEPGFSSIRQIAGPISQLATSLDLREGVVVYGRVDWEDGRAAVNVGLALGNYYDLLMVPFHGCYTKQFVSSNSVLTDPNGTYNCVIDPKLLKDDSGTVAVLVKSTPKTFGQWVEVHHGGGASGQGGMVILQRYGLEASCHLVNFSLANKQIDGLFVELDFPNSHLQPSENWTVKLLDSKLNVLAMEVEFKFDQDGSSSVFFAGLDFPGPGCQIELRNSSLIARFSLTGLGRQRFARIDPNQFETACTIKLDFRAEVTPEEVQCNYLYLMPWSADIHDLNFQDTISLCTESQSIEGVAPGRYRLVHSFMRNDTRQTVVLTRIDVLPGQSNVVVSGIPLNY